MKSAGSLGFTKLAAVVTIALGLAVHASACGSDARSTDSCRKLETERCTKAASCPKEFPDFATTYGSAASCQQYYDVQCGRGVQDSVKEPSKSELDACLKAIQSSCEAARDPASVCPFLTANEPPVDTGTETSSETGTDGGEAGTDAADGG